MNKKIVLTISAMMVVVAGVSALSAYEAHVINVTAHIENALTVPIEADGLEFGTVFPEEVAYKSFEVRLSDSFMTEGRVDDVEYVLRQKPKCGVPITGTDPVEYSEFVQVEDGAGGTFVCPDGSVMLPLLCPYLSKTELDVAGKPTGTEIPAFHGPLTNWTMADTINTQLLGRLSKADEKISTSWLIDLHAPCFQGMCAQDNVIPPDYQADPAYESQLFGCDLWLEVTNISLPGTALTVIKHVINDSGTGSSSASDFTMNVTGTNVSDPTFPGAESPGTVVTLDAGSYSVDETGPAGYTKTLSADCLGTIAVGEHKFCTITNDDIPREEGTLTVIKVVENSGVGTKIAGDFQMRIDGGNVIQGVANPVSVGDHTVSEADSFGYVTTYSADCPGGVANVSNGENETCTVTNTYPAGILTVIKVVVDEGGIGTKSAGDFQMTIDGGNVTQGVANPVSVGNHTVSEVNNFGYIVTYSAECPGGVANVSNGENETCTVTNTMPYGTITVTKTVVNNNGGLLEVDDFTLRIDGVVVTSGVAKNVAVGSHNVDEDGIFGYSASFSGDCDVSGNVSIAAGENKACTITNDDMPPSITLIKNVVGGSAAPDDFDLSIDGAIKTSGSSNQVIANTPHVIDEEVLVSGYNFTSITGSSYLGVLCPAALQGTITLLPGDVVTCTITNTHQ